MKTRMIVSALALCFFGAAVCFAQDAALGTWKLNEAKSKLGPGGTEEYNRCLWGSRRESENHN